MRVFLYYVYKLKITKLPHRKKKMIVYCCLDSFLFQTCTNTTFCGFIILLFYRWIALHKDGKSAENNF